MGTKAKRTVLCQDSLPWLESHSDLPAIVASIPDPSEVGLNKREYLAFFRRAARACLSAVRDTGYCIFLQTDRKQDGWMDKAHLCAAEAEALGIRMIWHKIALNKDVGKANLFRPTYSHMLCFSKRGPVGPLIPDVVFRGPVLYKNAFGQDAVLLVMEYLKHQGIKQVVDPFVGAGTTLAAANALGISALGIDIDPKQCKKAATATLLHPEEA